MNSLLIDTSWGHLSLSVATYKELIASITLNVNHKMNENLLNILDFNLKNLSFGIDVFDRLIAVTGPGSFTGIRIGVSTIQGIAAGLGKSPLGISSLDAAALVLKRDKVKIACRLRGKMFTFKEYDFGINNFSDYTNVMEDDLPEDTVFVNSKKYENSIANLSQAVVHKDFDTFLMDCIPFYMTKSEAEISFDKKSCI